MTQHQRNVVFGLTLLLGTFGEEVHGQSPASTTSEIAGVQTSIGDCPRLFVTVTWTAPQNRDVSQTTLSYGYADCTSSTGFIGGGVIPNTDFIVTRTSARLLTTTADGAIDLTWTLDGQSRYVTDGTTLFMTRRSDAVKTVHHSDSLSAIVFGSIAGRAISGRQGYVATVTDATSRRPDH